MLSRALWVDQVEATFAPADFFKGRPAILE